MAWVVLVLISLHLETFPFQSLPFAEATENSIWITECFNSTALFYMCLSCRCQVVFAPVASDKKALVLPFSWADLPDSEWCLQMQNAPGKAPANPPRMLLLG